MTTTTARPKLNYKIPDERERGHAKNIHAVPNRQWQRWSEHARLTFNYLYAQGTLNKAICGDEIPDAKTMHVIAWNLAWLAAGFQDQLLKLPPDMGGH